MLLFKYETEWTEVCFSYEYMITKQDLFIYLSSCLFIHVFIYKFLYSSVSV
jgi:hypothetical protein